MSGLILWLDLETTGLDPNKNQILEVGWAFAKAEDPFVLLPDTSNYQGVCYLTVLNDEITIGKFCLDMHTKNGLLTECGAEGRELHSIENTVLYSIAAAKLRHEQGPKDPIILAGSSIHFDRAFIKAQMPALDKILHYRMLDVSSLKLANPSVTFPKVSVHRAKDDILQSVADGLRLSEEANRLRDEVARQSDEIRRLDPMVGSTGWDVLP